jgi:hypothetical protein
MNAKTVFLTLMLAATPFSQAAVLTYEEELALLKKEHNDAIAQVIKNSENPVDQTRLDKLLDSAGADWVALF